MSDINKIRSWQRLEPTSRDSEMSDGIQATIHDPAWMLARQWQLGEFEGEDAGSPISVSLSTMQHKISKVIVNNNAFNYEKDYPLEVLIERTKLEIATQKENGDSSLETELDLQSRVKLGLQFQREIDIQLKDIVQPAEEINKFKKHLAKDPNLTFKELNSNQEEFEMEITKTYLSIIKGRVIDIYRIIVLPDHGGNILKDKVNEFFANSPNVVSIGNALDTAIKNLKHWWNGNIASPIPDEQEEPFFETPSDNNISAWNSRHLEYNLKVQIDGQDNDEIINMLILDADRI